MLHLSPDHPDYPHSPGGTAAAWGELGLLPWGTCPIRPVSVAAFLARHLSVT